MADDEDIQITTPLLATFIRPARARDVARVKALAPVSRLASALDQYHAAEKAAAAAAAPHVAPVVDDAHASLAPATAAALSQLHAVEGVLMVRAMIEAAKADGTIDAEERRRIFACLVDADASDSDRRALIATLDQPPDMDGLVACVTNPDLAVEVYAASLLAIRDDKPSEQRYLARLAGRLKLAPETVAAMHARFGDPPPLPSDG